ncbi:MAG: sodium-dependent bicarbonate transport family permease [Thaumarchaeota archaeon]|nr:sodium-dependent bicarbonate transport family permease [Nitrososphaerota archaeon]MBE44629.1 sodium-dependent bicarbonate transport family permease [Nitrososphaerota archaeon]|tara:strand:- start:621 stop:1694 length:1074 start_codon:yes stop_codon:yes gene_type:complete
MDTISLIQGNILTPVVLFFILGIVATRVKSDLKIPEAISSILPIYLLAAIGLHGGVEMRKTGLENVAIPILVAVVLAIALTVYHYQILRRLGKFNFFDSYALASTYGSVGAITFSVGLIFLRNLNIESEGFLAAVLAVLEPVSLTFCIFMVNRSILKQKKSQISKTGTVNEKEVSKQSNDRDTNSIVDAAEETSHSMRKILHDSITGKAIIILLGSIVIGYLIGEHGFASIEPVFEDMFAGAVAIFLLEMGLVAGQRLGEVKKVGIFLLGFAIVVPTINGILGVVVAYLMGLSMGGSIMFGLLLGSASFIAAPAVLRTAVPQANPSLYITAGLGITFPYNIIALLPIMYIVASKLYA